MVCERIIGMAWIDNRYLSPSARQFQQFVFDFYDKKYLLPLRKTKAVGCPMQPTAFYYTSIYFTLQE